MTAPAEGCTAVQSCPSWCGEHLDNGDTSEVWHSTGESSTRFDVTMAEARQLGPRQ